MDRCPRHIFALAGVLLVALAACASGNGTVSSTPLPPPVEMTLPPGVTSILVPPPLNPTEPQAVPTHQPPDGYVKLTNNASWSVCFVYITDPKQDTWGQDWLEPDELINPGDSHVFNPPQGIYDLRAEDCDFIKLDERYGADLTSPYDWQVYNPAILYYDEFNASGNWQVRADGGNGAVQGWVYELSVDRAGATVHATPGLNYSDLVVTVEATPTENGGSDSMVDYGVMCRVQANGDGYLFLVRSNGQYGIFKIENGRQTPLADWTAATGVLDGDLLNVIQGTCKGDTLSVRINGYTMPPVTDTRFSSGDVGLYAAQNGEGSAKADFDYFTVTVP